MPVVQPCHHGLLHPCVAGQFCNQSVIQPELIAGHISVFSPVRPSDVHLHRKTISIPRWTVYGEAEILIDQFMQLVVAGADAARLIHLDLYDNLLVQISAVNQAGEPSNMFLTQHVYTLRIAMTFLQNLLEIKKRHQQRAFTYTIGTEQQSDRCQLDPLRSLEGTKIGEGNFGNAHNLNSILIHKTGPGPAALYLSRSAKLRLRVSLCLH